MSDSLGPNLARARLWDRLGGEEDPDQPPGIMPGHATWCVPLCPNNFKNSHDLVFYRMPNARRIRREYVRLLRTII